MIETILILQIFLALLVGCVIGTITGLTPGLHINMISVLIVSFSPLLLQYLPIIAIISFIVSMSITHTFIDFIPSIFLGAPDEDTSLSILPGHSLLLKGKGYEAVMCTLYGSLIGIFTILFFSPIFISILPKIYTYLKKILFFILLFSSLYLIFREKNKINSLIIFLMSGFIGLVVFNLNSKEPLLPMLSGFFGSSSLIISIIKKQKIPKQKVSKVKITKEEIKNSVLATSLASPLCSFLPALGSGQAAVISSDLIEEKDKKQFLITLGSINTIIMGLSFISLYSLNVKRNGSVVAISKILENFSLNYLYIIILVIIFSGIISFFIGCKLAKFFSLKIHEINYRKISFFVLFFMSILVFYFSSFIGFSIFLTSTFLGLYTIFSGERRTLMMGCLMLPSLVLYFPI
ncbi:MAG: tripartite tricarboxylate transporter permease [Candidatus Pacearchaeota archaeon]